MSQNPNLSQPFQPPPQQNVFSPNSSVGTASETHSSVSSPGNILTSQFINNSPLLQQGMIPTSGFSLRPPLDPILKPSTLNSHGGSDTLHTPSPNFSQFPMNKQNMQLNGPLQGGSPYVNSNAVNGAEHMNGVTNRLPPPSHPSSVMQGPGTWNQGQRLPVTPGQPNHKLPPPPQYINSQSPNLPPHSLHLNSNVRQTLPKMSQMPSPGLPLPYNNQMVSSSSPQVTPGTSQPTSARSSRNPSPISSQRYDYMEGQFSNKPSPSNSTSNLPNLAVSPNASVPSPHNTNLTEGRTFVSPSPSSNPYAGPGNNYSANNSVPPPVTPQSMAMRPQYPKQVGYNQAPSYTSPVVSQPTFNQLPAHSNLSAHLPPSSCLTSPVPPQNNYNTPSPAFPPPPQSNYNSTSPAVVPPQQGGYSSSPYPQPHYPGGMPEGPVGGVSGYDPQLHAKMAGMSVHSSFSRLWGNDTINLLQDRNILPPLPLEAPKPVITPDRPNCSPNIFRSTLTKVPDTSSLLQKSRLPFGILIHPFRDAASLSVIQCNTIVRCRECRTYINPFVSFIDQRRWKCNLCFRINDLPEEFLYDPNTRSYGDPIRRPEIKNATIEFIAPSDYMVRPPQPAVYLFLLDVSHGAIETGYLATFCQTVIDSLEELPGDSRTKVGFVTFDGSIHFYNLGEGLNQPHMLVVSDLEEVFLPSPDNLLVNLQESKSLIIDLLNDLPKRFSTGGDINCCLGSALQVAYKLMSPVGGRITVVQTCLPNYGPGALKNREDPNQRAAKDISNIGPANDFYKKLALDCSGKQVAVDLFLLSSQYVDIATISCISKFSAGSVSYYPGYHHQLGRLQVDKFGGDLKRYLTRRIGFEAVMRIRCTRGLAIHTFHGNFFVRSIDLLSLPNVNPDSGYGMQISIEENLTDYNSVCFQAAVLYTSSNGERRIRVHTLCLPVVSILTDVLGGADQETIIGLVSKMAVDRSVSSSLVDARDALINVCLDILGVFRSTVSGQTAGALMSPYSSRLIPLFILALLKHVAFRTGISTKLDDRVFAMDRMKTMPLSFLMKYIYPTLYPVHALDEKNAIHQDEDMIVPQPVILQLSSEKIDRHGAYILDTMDFLYLFIGRAISDQFCINVLNVPNFSAIPEEMCYLPVLSTPESERMRNFVNWLQDQRPFQSPLKIIREDSKHRGLFLQYMLDDKTESMFSYYEFLQHIRQQISK